MKRRDVLKSALAGAAALAAPAIVRAESQKTITFVPHADLASLAGQVQDAGLKVWINVDGQRGDVPPGIDLSAYRIIQEALTNVIKHGAASAANVTISYRPASVTVEVADQGAGAPPAKVPASRGDSGHGIIGMRERVAVFGGEFSAGPRPDGGFLVRACFPIAEVTR